MCLDWSAPHHWNGDHPPCTHCRTPTHLLDDAGRPAHKICTEQLLPAPVGGGDDE